jgi:hypothetical protein
MKHTLEPKAIFDFFKAQQGSDYIATQFAIHQLIKWLIRRKPRKILEVGAGIGTLTFAVCSCRGKFPFDFITIEWNQYCKDSLSRNLIDQVNEYKQISSLEDLEKIDLFDFIIIDGGEQDPNFICHLALNGTIFVEGFMDKKHQLIHECFLGRRNYIWTNFRSDNRKHGIWIFRFEPNFPERFWFTLNTMINRFYNLSKRLKNKCSIKTGVSEKK